MRSATFRDGNTKRTNFLTLRISKHFLGETLHDGICRRIQIIHLAIQVAHVCGAQIFWHILIRLIVQSLSSCRQRIHGVRKFLSLTPSQYCVTTSRLVHETSQAVDVDKCRQIEFMIHASKRLMQSLRSASPNGEVHSI